MRYNLKLDKRQHKQQAAEFMADAVHKFHPNIVPRESCLSYTITLDRAMLGLSSERGGIITTKEHRLVLTKKNIFCVVVVFFLLLPCVSSKKAIKIL